MSELVAQAPEEAPVRATGNRNGNAVDNDAEGARRFGRLHVLRLALLAERGPTEAGDGLQPRDGPADEHSEGVMIAPPCPLDEIPLVHRHPS
jgi:hypothetical protein